MGAHKKMSKYLSNIKTAAISLSNGMSITYPMVGEISKLSLSVGKPKTYNIVGGRILFIDEYCNSFAIPEIPGIKALLLCDNYKLDSSLEVPFVARESYPTVYKDKWANLLAEMRASV